MIAVVQDSRDVERQNTSGILCIAHVDVENHAMMLANTFEEGMC